MVRHVIIFRAETVTASWPFPDNIKLWSLSSCDITLLHKFFKLIYGSSINLPNFVPGITISLINSKVFALIQRARPNVVTILAIHLSCHFQYFLSIQTTYPARAGEKGVFLRALRYCIASVTGTMIPPHVTTIHQASTDVVSIQIDTGGSGITTCSSFE